MGRGDDRNERRQEPTTIANVRALRPAGRTLVIVVFDPKVPDAPVRREHEVMIPVSEIHRTSAVQKEGDRGNLVIPLWLAVDRNLAEDDEDD